MKRLTDSEFRETFSAPMRAVAHDAEPPFDFWAYFETIPSDDFEQHNCSEGNVENSWIDSTGRFEHVLVSSRTPNVFMVLVLDLSRKAVLGHRLLNLNQEYGVEP